LAQLSSAVNSVAPLTAFTITDPSSPSPSQQTEVVNNFQSKITADQQELNTFNTSIGMSTIRGAPNVLQNDIAGVNTAITISINNTLSLGAELDAIMLGLNNFAASLNTTVRSIWFPKRILIVI